MSYDPDAVDNSVLAHLKFVTLQLLRALRDNPLAIAEGSDDADTPWVKGVFYQVERQEPTSDVGTITFAANVAGYRAAIVEFTGNWTGQANEFLNLQIRENSGTWRTIGRTPQWGASSVSGVLARWLIENIDNADGSNILKCWGIGGGLLTDGTTFDRTDASGVYQTEVYGGFATFADAWNKIRITTSGSSTMEGSNAAARSVATLKLAERATRDVIA